MMVFESIYRAVLDMSRWWDTILIWVLMFVLPSVVMGGRLIVWGLWGRKVEGEARCKVCGEVVEFDANHRLGVCVGCGADLRKKRGVIWGRERTWKGVIGGGVVICLPWLTWGGLIGMKVYELETGNPGNGQSVGVVRTDRLVWAVGDHYTSGLSNHEVNWELVRRTERGEVSRSQMSGVIDAYVAGLKKERWNRYAEREVVIAGYEKGLMGVEELRKLTYAVRGEVEKMKVRWDEEKGKVRVRLFLTKKDIGLSRRFVEVLDAKVDGKDVGIEVDGRYPGWRSRDYVVDWLGEMGEGEHELVLKVLVGDFYWKDCLGLDWGTKREGWPREKIGEKVVEVRQVF